MPIYEEKNKVNGKTRYFISTYVKDETGKSKKITRRNKEWVGRNGYFLAQQEEIRLKKGIKKITNDVTVEELINKKIENDSSYLKLSSIKRYKTFAVKYIFPYFKNKRIYELTSKDIIKWHTWLEEQNINIETMKKIHNMLSSSLEFGINYYELEKNVVNTIGNFKNKRGEVKEKIQFLTYQEFNSFIKQENNEIYKDFFTLLFYTGMRRGELLAITKDDLDFNKKTIKINKSINPANGKNATVPKTNKSNRIIPMINQAYEILLKYKNTNLIFGLDKIKTTTLTRKCHNNCKKAKINKKIRIHDLRHSFVALCIQSGVQIEKISEYVGHENISTTYDIYSHLYPTAKSELILKVENFIKKT